MNKDQSLKPQKEKIILLMVGNDETGKKSITAKWMNLFKSATEENRSFYKIISFVFEETFNEEIISIPIEIRILDGDEFETDLKINAVFFKGAYGAFVVTAIMDYMSFQDGIKWKEKVDIMCCLPNRFPLPIFLLVNKFDESGKYENKPWLENNQIKSYVEENQFIKNFYISTSEKDSCCIRESTVSNHTVPLDCPLREMINTILKFKDIRQQILKIPLDKENIENNQSSKKCFIL